MRLRVVLLGLAALATAGVTALLVQGWLDRQRSELLARTARPVPPPAAGAVLVARRPLPTGSFVKTSDLRWQPWPRGEMDPSYVRRGTRTRTSFAGAVVRRSIVAGQPVTDALLVKPGERGFLAAVLSPGTRAVAVPVNASSAIAGLVFPGDRVDLILTHRLDEAGEGGRRDVRRASETVLTNVRVLAIDQSTDDQKARPGVPKTATLEVTPRQAEMVAVAMDLGKLSLSLRSLARASAADQATDEDGTVLGERGNTLTRDSDVSRLILQSARRPRGVVHVVRGSKAAEIEVAR